MTLLRAKEGLAYRRRRKQQTASQKRSLVTAKQESSVCRDGARVNAFFLCITAVVSLMQGDLCKPRFLLLFINGKEDANYGITCADLSVEWENR